MENPPNGLEMRVSLNKFVKQLKETTSARIGIGQTGFRYPTDAQLKFRQDLAFAKDAVWKEPSEALLKKLGLLKLESKAPTREAYLMNTSLGRFLSKESCDSVKNHFKEIPDVLLLTSDGLSSEAFENNVPQMLELFRAHLKSKGFTVGPPLFIQRARVAIMDDIGELIPAKAGVFFIGERPGLGTCDSLSCYFEYQPCLKRVESDRNVLSNIHSKGIPPTEAALLIADAIIEVLHQKKSGMGMRFKFA